MAAIVVSLARGPEQVIPAFRGGELLRRLHPLHLWFLEYLCMLYLLAALIAWRGRALPAGLMNSIHRTFRWALQKPYAPALFALFSWLPLASMRGTPKDCDGFAPEWRILVAYLVPFSFGWLLYHSRDLLPRFEKHIGTYLVLQFFAFLVYGLTPPNSPVPQGCGRRPPLLVPDLRNYRTVPALLQPS